MQSNVDLTKICWGVHDVYAERCSDVIAPTPGILQHCLGEEQNGLYSRFPFKDTVALQLFKYW